MILQMRKRPKIFYYTSFICLCSATAFFSYFVLLRDVERDTNVISVSSSEGHIGKEITERLLALESGLRDNRHLLDNVRSKVERLSKTVYMDQGFGSAVARVGNRCPVSSDSSHADFDVAKMYEEIPFDNADGGVWKQGWDVQLNMSRLAATKLRVFVVPHSHNDPGWLKTFDQYFKDQTRHILDNMLKKLPENPSMKFIWAETSYFALWWDTLTSQADKDIVKVLLEDGQLEIVTGGWVMTDEASSHYYAIISQMVEGHEWLRRNLNYKPKNGWAIDPFGLSPSMAFLLKRMGFEAMVIQRVHYSVKKYLAQNQLLEFNWRQYHEVTPAKDILCHVMPFYSYDVPHTCGPDPKVCCQFDFKRMPPYRMTCPWKVSPQRITEGNVHQKATLLLEQYRKKAMLYRTNALLVPLGDDFRYDKSQEWDYQGINYQRLFDYMNSKSEWNVEARFATLADYFEAVMSTKVEFPSVTGDFFTYADRDDHYWSGYFTSRPFYKRYDRILESYLRAAEIVFSFGTMLSEDKTEFQRLHDEGLDYARTNLALFQHHDGITGTAKDFVVNDYADRMHKSIVKSQEIIARSTASLLDMSLDSSDLESPQNVIFLEVFPDYNSLSQNKIVKLDDARPKWRVIVYNSLAFERREILCIYLQINVTDWTLKDSNGQAVEVQLNYVWSNGDLVADKVEVCFAAHLKPLSIMQFTLETSSERTSSLYSVSTVTLYNFENNISDKLISNMAEAPSEIELESSNLKLVISGADGMLRRVIQYDQGTVVKSHEIRAQFMTFGTKTDKKEAKSGAYLFLPDAPEAQGLNYGKPKIRVTKGNLFSRIEMIVDKPIHLVHRMTVIHGDIYFRIENDFLLTRGAFSNRELLMRFFTEIQNEDVFYTDLNGLQMIRRKKYSKIPLQGNVYPLSALMYVEDDTTRVNIITAQPLGGTSYHPGFIDIFMDRRLLQDDARGLGQGVIDNRRTVEVFKVFIEPKPKESLKPTLSVNKEVLTLLHAPFVMMSTQESSKQELSLVTRPLPCDVHLLNIRARDSLAEFHVTFHRMATSCDTLCNVGGSDALRLDRLLPPNVRNVLKPSTVLTSLSYMHELKNTSLSAPVIIEESDFATIALKLRE